MGGIILLDKQARSQGGGEGAAPPKARAGSGRNENSSFYDAKIYLFCLGQANWVKFSPAAGYLCTHIGYS